MTDIRDQPWYLIVRTRWQEDILQHGLRAFPQSYEGITREIWWKQSTGRELAARLRDLADMIEGTTTLNEAKYRVDTRFPDGTWRPHSQNLRLSRAIGLMTAYHGEPWPCRVVNAQGNPVAYGPPPGEPDFVARGVADMREDET